MNELKVLSEDLMRFLMFWKQRSLVSFYETFSFSLLLDTCKNSIFAYVALYVMCMKPHKIYIETGLNVDYLARMIYIHEFA
jgi:hypothetical protein